MATRSIRKKTKSRKPCSSKQPDSSKQPGSADRPRQSVFHQPLGTLTDHQATGLRGDERPQLKISLENDEALQSLAATLAKLLP